MDTAVQQLPENTVYAIAAQLIGIQHAVAETFGGRKVDADPRALSNAVAQIRSILRSIDGAYGVIIGGLAVQNLGYERYTSDVDLVVDSEHFDEVLAKLRENDFVIQNDFSLKNWQSGAKLDLLKEGTLLKHARIPLPHPSLLGKSGWFATLPALIQLKLQTPRMQDKADIVELLKRHMSEADTITNSLAPEFRGEFNVLLEQARSELA